MSASRDGDIGGVLHEVAGGRHRGREDVEESLDCGETASGDAQHYEQPAVDTLPLGNNPAECRENVQLSLIYSYSYSCFTKSPGYPVLPCEAGVCELHVEKWRKDKGQECDRGGPDQVQDGAEAGDRLGDEQQHKCGARAQSNSFPVEA